MKKYKYLSRFFLLGLFLISGVASFAQISGKWRGYISAVNQRLYFEVDFHKPGEARVHIPDQNVYDLVADTIISQERSIIFRVDTQRINMHFDGVIFTDDSIGGSYSQAGGVMGRFSLTRAPQVDDDWGDVFWTDQQVYFHTDTLRLAGTLSLPDTVSRHPAVIFISGSGQHTRDVPIFGFRVFKTLARPFLEAGFAVLRYDDRGAGDSEAGDLRQVDSRDFARDAYSAYQLLETHPNIDPDQIGVLGHSEGGLIACLLTEMETPAFLILVAAPAVQGKRVMLSQSRALLRAQNIRPDHVQKAVDYNRIVYNELMQPEPDSTLIYETLYEAISSQSLLDQPDRFKQMAQRELASVTTQWFRFFISFDPGELLEQAHMPVLAVYGSKDLQIVPEVNKPVMDTLASQKENFTVKEFQGANHLFQEADTGSIEEYRTLPPKFINGFTDALTQWAQSVVF